MVAVISSHHNMSKEAPVVVMPEAPEVKSSQKKHVILTSWASVATALLLMLLVGGAFYVADLKSNQCTETTSQESDHTTKDYSRTYDRDGDKTNEDFHVDEDDQTELIIKKNDDGNIEMITAIDFKKKISASYIPRSDQCLLLAGTDMEWTDDWGSEESETVEVAESEIEEKNYMVSGNKVTDLSILPSAMKPYCTGKPTYWMQPKDDDSMEVERQKRDVCVCADLYIYYYKGKYYYYWYYYYCSC